MIGLGGLSLAALVLGGSFAWRGGSHSVVARSTQRPVSPREANHIATVIHAGSRSSSDIGAMDSTCAVLLARNVFSTRAQPADAASTSTSSSAASSASAFALKGISQEDNRFTAFVEDSVARRIVEVHVGDIVGQGQVRDLNLHQLDYEVAGNIVHVEIGRTLDGASFAAAGPRTDSAATAISSDHKHHHGEAPVTDIEDGH